MHLEMLSAQCRPFCSGFIVLIRITAIVSGVGLAQQLCWLGCRQEKYSRQYQWLGGASHELYFHHNSNLIEI